MKMRSLSLTLATILALSSSSSFAQIEGVAPECQEPVMECVQGCKFVLERADEYIKGMTEESDLQKALIAEQEGKINRLEQDKNAFYRNPVIMGLLGALAASALIKK